MRDPFIAVDTTTDLSAHARELRRCWDGGLGTIRPVIEASWARAAAAGVDRDLPEPHVAFMRDELDDRRAASPLAGCLDVLRTCLGGFAQDSEHIMVVVDAACRVLWVEGDRGVLSQADRIMFTEGMTWTEASVGTNAIGTAMAIDHAVQVFGPEHFSADQHPWWCSAAPIHDPGTGELIGVVDLSGPMHTAHPHSLALVAATAGMAEERLRMRRVVADERLRVAFIERTLGARRPAHGLVTDDGRVLDPQGNLVARAEIPAGGGPVALPGGRTAIAEPLGRGGHVLWSDGTGSARAPRTALRVLGTGAATVRVGSGEPVRLAARHGELLTLLALHPEGLDGPALMHALHGADDVSTVTLRAEVSRLRSLLPGTVGSRPYRLKTALQADLLELQRALAHDEVDAALAAHTGPLLPGSQAPGIVRARAELEAAVRRTLPVASLDALWRWLQAPARRADEAGLALFVRRCPAGDARRSVAAARLRALQLSG